MPSKQFTFKTTKDTDWLRQLLEHLPDKVRSEFIRNRIIDGLERKGMLSWDGRNPVIFMNDLPSTFEAPDFERPPTQEPPKKIIRENQRTEPTEPKSQVEKTEEIKVEKMEPSVLPPSLPPPIASIGLEEDTETDLDSILDNVFG